MGCNYRSCCLGVALLKSFIIKAFIIFGLSFLLIAIGGPIIQNGDRYYQIEENKNYNGYFSILDENKFISIGMTYDQNTNISGYYGPAYHYTHLYNGVPSGPIMLSLAYPVLYRIYKYDGSLVSTYIPSTYTYTRLSWTSNSFALYGDTRILDATTNYRVEIYIMGVSNYA